MLYYKCKGDDNMLKKIKIKNYFSIYDEVTIDLTKDNYKYKKEIIFQDLVNPLVIYVLNGSGKTTLLKAIYSVSRLMYQSISSEDLAFFPNVLDNNNFEKNTIDSISEITFYLFINNTNYEYHITIDTLYGINFEYLKNSDTDEALFARKLNKFYNSNNHKEELAETLEGAFYPALRYIGKEAKNKEITDVFNFFNNIVYIDSHGEVFGDLIEKTKIMDLIIQYSPKIKKIIKNYGNFPVYDVIQEEDKEKLSKSSYIQMEGSKERLPYILASDGIKTHNRLLATILAMPQNSLLLVDELEHNLHPLIAQKIIKQMNQYSIQMLFTSHNTNLLQQLRPDQIIFAQWKNNESKYQKLSKIYPNIREINNIEKMYFGGLFDEDE